MKVPALRKVSEKVIGSSKTLQRNVKSASKRSGTSIPVKVESFRGRGPVKVESFNRQGPVQVEGARRNFPIIFGCFPGRRDCVLEDTTPQTVRAPLVECNIQYSRCPVFGWCSCSNFHLHVILLPTLVVGAVL